MTKQKIQHIIERPYDVRQPITSKFLINIENFIDDNNLESFKEIPILYKYKNIVELKKSLQVFGEFIDTPVGSYVKGKEFVLLINVSSEDLIFGMYINFDVIYNSNLDIAKFYQKFTETLSEYASNEILTKINWMYKTMHGMSEAILFDTNDTILQDAAYPYIQGGCEDYFEKYLSSNESVLMLLGPPGTGKTRFIKGLMRYMAKKNDNGTAIFGDSFMSKKAYSVMYSNSQETYEDDSFFIEFVRGDCQLLILEDADFNLRARDLGNTFMQKLLNASDGIINLRNKKIVITTNITNQQKTDSALLRPGRTFGVIESRYLTKNEAINLANILGKDCTIFNSDRDSFSLAEIYNNKLNSV